MSGMYVAKESGITFNPALTPTTTPNKQAFVKAFKDNFTYEVMEHPNPHELVFSLKNVDVSFANALRRVMISEVPTVAIEIVYIDNNTSITHDEVLSHRLGLIPLDVDPEEFEFYSKGATTSIGDDNTNDHNTVVFKMDVYCPSRPPSNSELDSTKIILPPDLESVSTSDSDALARDVAHKHTARGKGELPNRPYTKHVYSRDLIWCPEGDQETRLKRKPKVVEGDILITKLRQNQRITLTCHARKSTGKDHAKYSPVATASYRMKPVVELKERVFDEDADRLVVLEPGVFEIREVKGVTGKKREAVMVNEYVCTMSRNFMRDPYLKDVVVISRDPNHFIFSVETVGMLTAVEVLKKSLVVLREKAENLAKEIKAVKEGRERGESM
eukprot:CAMPEP_0118656390 /NCGR_PEP_ID=MMETSP0785-20121206/13465_1 /TAXON_ID=91992 /ORGANISM="Bolidomonas pacifica, Strain CCMP 1866" /LENGTH=385 /DNA_ID=CAMNT_0006549249 /DNA_START=65 /DNA_END=1219 /DNA_ORIENTATION=+